jgi:Sulfotransferase family
MREQPVATPSRKARSGRPKVVYVMGAGHSGSTILGVTLGNCTNVFYAGELEEWLINSGLPPLGGSERARFWGTVRDSVAGAEDLFGGGANRYLERSSTVFRLDRWAARRRLRRRYRRVTEDLYRAVAHAAGATHVVDTSHFPLRARELKALAGIEVYLVFLVRDPQQVVASELRHISPHDVAERRLRAAVTNANLWLTYLLSVAVFLGHQRERRLFLRHEDFLADPAGVLRQILDVVDSSAAIPDLTALRTGSPLLGNKLIRSEVVALEGPKTSRTRSSRMTALIQRPWEAVLSRLKPAAIASTEREHASRLGAR